MLTARSVVAAFFIVVMVSGAGVVSGQNYPSKTIRIVAAQPGTSIDFVARIVAQGMSGPLGQQVIVDNRAASVVADTVARAAPDGYTLAFGGSAIWITPLLQKMSYDPVKDFSPVTLAVSTPFVLVVHPSLPVKSVKELIALAKARPGELNYAQGPSGGGGHLSGSLFQTLAGTKMVFIPFSDAQQGLPATISGETQVMIYITGAIMPQVKSGRLKALAVTTLQRTALAPGLPTVAESGLPGYEMASTTGVLAPAGTPAAIVNRLNQEMVRVLNGADAKEKIFNNGADALGGSPEQFTAFIKSETVKWSKVIESAGIKAQ